MGGHPDVIDTLPYDPYDSVPVEMLVDHESPKETEATDPILRAKTRKLGDPVDDEVIPEPSSHPASAPEPTGVDVPQALESSDGKPSEAMVHGGVSEKPGDGQPSEGEGGKKPGFDAMNHQAHL